MSGRQSAVICHQLNELLSRHPLGFGCHYHTHRSFFSFWAIAMISTIFGAWNWRVGNINPLLASTCGNPDKDSRLDYAGNGPNFGALLKYSYPLNLFVLFQPILSGFYWNLTPKANTNWCTAVLWMEEYFILL